MVKIFYRPFHNKILRMIRFDGLPYAIFSPKTRVCCNLKPWNTKDQLAQQNTAKQTELSDGDALGKFQRSASIYARQKSLPKVALGEYELPLFICLETPQLGE